MKELRSGSQILFGFLPEQTVDLQGRVWRVREWVNPRHESIDQETLRRELIRAASAWSIQHNDGGYVDHLRQGRDVQLLTLNKRNGVAVEPFPEVWLCKRCGRLADSLRATCPCGSEAVAGQLHFVGYCEKCGALREPWVPKCKEHKQVRVVFPGTSSAREIRFECPVCNKLIRKGFGFPRCQCGQGSLTFNVHRSASVYTPRTVVVVNAPSPERIRELTVAGGPARALEWVLGGMETRSFREVGITTESLVQNLLSQGISETVARAMAEEADRAGELSAPSGDEQGISSDVRDEAEAQAVTIALAVEESRMTVRDLQDRTESTSEIGLRYRSTYPVAIERAGLHSVDLIDSFPVLTGNFAFTRGGSGPGESRLVPFRDRRGDYVVYSELGVTEAVFFRLSPSRVAHWLAMHDVSLSTQEEVDATRRAIINLGRIPGPGELADESPGSLLLTLVHSLSHRMIRMLAVHAGIDREALSELLVPAHLGFFIYAAARGDFVLGGLQAVFEAGLDNFLSDVVEADLRCPLDPGCMRHGGACMACLHVGEPSCRYFNSFLHRAVLDTPSGYLASVGSASA